MPTYEYECKKCSYRFEKFQSMTDLPVKRCPKCKCAVSRLIGTGAGIIFKGKGFYQTDYKTPGPGKEQADSSEKNTGKDKQKDTAPCGKSDPCSSCVGSEKK